MEITTNSCGRNESKLTAVSQQPKQQERCSPTPPPTLHPQASAAPNSSATQSSGTTNSSDLKYLHKKFKRIASTTLTNHDSGSSSSIIISSSTNSSTTSSNSINTSGSESKPVVAITSALLPVHNSGATSSSSSSISSTVGNATQAKAILAAFVTSATVPAPVQCANESRSSELVNSAHEYPPLERPKAERLHIVAATIDENSVYSSRHQLTPLSGGIINSRKPQQQPISSSSSSNGASLNCANDIISDSHSFISGDLIPRPSEELKPYYPSVNNNSAINISCDSNERNLCNSRGSSATSRSSTLSPPESTVRLSSSYDVGNSSTFAITHQQHQHLVQTHPQHLNSQRPPYDSGHNSPLPFVTNNNSSSSPSPSSGSSVPSATTIVPAPGRYVCPFCQMNCSKPSVLEKHIRRHTNERPFRCDPCGIAFKTKSNLYKHCRSRAHASKSQGEDIGAVLDEEGSLGGSDVDDKELSNSGSEIINRNSPMDDRIHSPQLLVEKPYKPKFHNAALYTKFDANSRGMIEKLAASGQQQQQLPSGGGPFPNSLNQQLPTGISQPGGSMVANNVHPSSTSNSTYPYLNGQNVESLEQHISKLISDNEAIVEVVEAPLQKKYHKITGITRGISVSSSAGQQGSSGSESSSSTSGTSNNARIANALLLKQQQQQQQQQQRLNEELLIQQQHQPYALTNLVPSEQNVIIISNRVAPSQAKPVTQLPVVVPQNHLVVQPPQVISRSPSRGPEVVQYQQPLNLSKPVMSSSSSEQTIDMDQFRKRSNEIRYSREPSPAASMVQFQQVSQQMVQVPIVQASPQIQPMPVNDHPQNPEKSIIKDLLLNSQRFGIVQNPENENLENLFTCKSCNYSFRNAEALKYHTICHCEGNSSALNSPSSSAPISPVGSPSANFFRSRYNPTSLKTLARVSLNPPKNPSSLSKLAKSKLKGPRGSRPENISVPSKESSSSSSSAIAGPSHSPAVSNASPITVAKVIDAVQNPLPSPGPLLGNTRLVDFQSNSKPESSRPFQESNVVSHVQNEQSPMRKRSIYLNEEQSNSPRRVQNHPNLQLFGGNMEVIDRTEEIPTHRHTSGGTITRITQDVDKEMHDSVRMGMHSGGSFLHLPKPGRSDSTSPVLPVNPATPKLVVTITPTLTPNFYSNHQHQPASEGTSNITHFHFPPINAITAFNPLTLPQASASAGQATQIMHAGKLIPYVQGIPGPNSLQSETQLPQKPSPRITSAAASSNLNPAVLQSISISTGNHHFAMVTGQNTKIQSPSLLSIAKPIVDQQKPLLIVPPIKNGMTKEIWSPAKQDLGHIVPPKKSFNFTRIADNLSPRKRDPSEPIIKKEEIRHFNFENLISKSEILIKSPVAPPPPIEIKTEHLDSKLSLDVQPQPISGKAKFLRPNSLPLKPGTFTPKRHHGITPTHNTMPLISPETPRPSKSCRELYFNGHAYTNIGLKSSTKPFYCTVNKTQPFYVQTQKQLSMYSNWQVHPENNPHPLGLKPVAVMALYNSTQQHNHQYSIAATAKLSLSVVNSSSASVCIMTTMEVKSSFPPYQPPPFPSPNSANSSLQQAHLPPHLKQSFTGLQQFNETFPPHPPRSESSERTLSGGFESTEEYTYVRGRGRGKYVCKECGIRCKKPSMLKKHIRTHTDVRPYSCQHCNFHFKTKGNLTKHMKSKSHYKKCTELGLNPIPTMPDDDGMDVDIEGDQQSISSERTSTIPGDSDTGSDSEGEESDDSDESKSRLPEHEAAHCLLSLSMTPPTSSQQPSSKSYHSPGSYPMQQHHHQYLYDHHPSARVGYSPHPVVQSELQSQSSQPLPGDSSGQPNRRIITFANTPKVEFKFDQYYDDPNLSKKQYGKEDDGVMPIDLTKKSREALDVERGFMGLRQQQSVGRSQQVIVRVSDVVTPITGTADLLTTLVSNTDKIPMNHHGFISNGKDQLLVGDNNEYFQEYIKQRALQDSRMKQCQMKVSSGGGAGDAGVNQNHFEEHQKLQYQQASIAVLQDVVPVKVVLPLEKSPFRVINGGRTLERKPVELVPAVVSKEAMTPAEVVPVKPQSVPSFSNREEIVGPKEAVMAESMVDPINVSKLDNVVEVAAVPTIEPVTVGLQRPRSDSVKSVVGNPIVSGAADSSNEGAKSVASEFLKLAAKTVGGMRKREDSESGTASDQESLAVPSPKMAPIVAPVVGVPPVVNPSTNEQIDRSAIVAARTVVVGEDGFKSTPASSEFPSITHFQDDGGRPVCEICHKKFHKISQLKIHMNIHYMERKFRCEPCGTSFRSQGLFLKHERSATHRNKVSMTTTFGIATDSNPRPFYCRDCDVGFRIHGHLAKHLRSKMHVLKLECLGKLPFGTYTEIERSGTNLTEIDTTDCENSLSSLKMLAIRLNVKDPANILPGSGGGSSGGDETGGGNETDSCDDNQYADEEDDSQQDETGDDQQDELADSDQQQSQVVANNNTLKRKPDEGSTSFEDGGCSDPKRSRFPESGNEGIAGNLGTEES